MNILSEELQEILDFPGGIPRPPRAEHYMPYAQAVSMPYSQFPYATSPRPPSGFLRLLDELYPDDEDDISDDPDDDRWTDPGSDLGQWPSDEWPDEDEFGGITPDLQALYEESMEASLNPSNSNILDHQSSLLANQIAATQAPLLVSSSSTFPMLSPPTQSVVRATFSPNVPVGDFDFGPIPDFAQLMDEFFPESVDQIPNVSSLNEWPNDDASLPTD